MQTSMIRADISSHLKLPAERFDALWKAVHKVRSTSKSVTVNVDDLKNLLMDHSKLFDLAERRAAT